MLKSIKLFLVHFFKYSFFIGNHTYKKQDKSMINAGIRENHKRLSSEHNNQTKYIKSITKKISFLKKSEQESIKK